MSEESKAPGRPSVRLWRDEATEPFPPARLFCGCFSAFPALLEALPEELEQQIGPIEERSAPLAFPETRRYGRSMGSGLTRIFFVFKGLYPQDCLAEIKLLTCGIEEKIARSGKWPAARPVNLDPGLLCEGRLVLASTKDRGHRLPRRSGIYEEVTLLFHKGAFRPLPWTYPDFREAPCLQFFEAVRARFMQETREIRRVYRTRAENLARKWERNDR